MSIQQIDRGTAGNPSDRFKIGTALDTAQANDEYLDYVNTVADLALLSLSVGDVKRTKGCLSIGDGGHGTFIVEAASGSPDGYSRILLANGNHAVLEPINGGVVLEQFGGVSGGVTDNLAAINRYKAFNAINKCSLLVDKSYALSDSFELDSNVTITGSGEFIALASPPNAQSRTHFGLFYGYIKNNIVIGGGLHFDLSAIASLPTSAASVRAITMYGCNDFYISDCTFVTPGGAVAAMGCHDYWVDNCEATSTDDMADAVFDNWGEANRNFYDFYLTNLTVHGEDLARWGVLCTGTSYPGYSLSGYNFFIDNINIYGCTLDGVQCNGREPTLYDFSVTNVFVNGARKGLSLADCVRPVVDNISIINTTNTAVELWTESSEGGVTGVEDGRFGMITLTDVASSRSGGAQPPAMWIKSGSDKNSFQDIRIKGSAHYFGLYIDGDTNKVFNHSISLGDGSPVVNTGTNNALPGGKYTATLTSVANVSASSFTYATYDLRGDTCYVDFLISVTPTLTATYTQIDLSLPLTGASGASLNCFGTVVGGTFTGGYSPGVISGDTVNIRATVAFVSAHTDSRSYRGRFSYQVSRSSIHS